MSDELVVWRQTVAGPELLIGGIVVREWLGTNHNEAAALLAGKINSAIESKLVEREAATVERCAKHRVQPSDLVGWFGRCSCANEGMPVDFETEADYLEHLRSLSPDPDYIARREAQARLEEAEWWRKRDTVFEVDFVEKSQRIPSLRRALARLAPKTEVKP